MLTGFPLGSQIVDRAQVDADLIRKMADSARNIQTEGNPSPESWTALADRVTQNDAVSQQDLSQLQDLGKACWAYHKKLHARFRDAHYKDPAIAAQLAEVHVYQNGADKIRDALMLASAKTAVAAAVGATFGPTALVTAYTAYAKLDDASLKPLVSEIQDLRDGRSHTRFDGNQVRGVHRQEIWPEMIHMLDGAIERGKQGQPTEIDAQYYELTNPQIVGKLAQAAEAGNKVRVNVDAGRLVAFKGTHVEMDEVPDKLRSLLQLSAVKGDVGISAYPVPKLLGDPNDLMHRKGLRVGDTFLHSGMNANAGSGENVDAGYVIEGPAAKRLVQNFARDVAASAGASNEEIYGKDPLGTFMDNDINLGTRGLIALMDCQNGPSPAGTPLPVASSLDELGAVAARYGQKVSDYVELPSDQLATLIAEGKQVPLSRGGKKKFLELADRALGATRTPTNLARCKDIGLPDGRPVGATRVSIADQPVERQAIMLSAIQNADKFIYIPAFVMTRSVAAMLVAKRDEMKAQGKDIDIRVIADPGIYPDGGTPNQAGVEFLENAAIPVRWAMLPRSGDHDRKIHAKEILTDKGEFYGSTNFSNKGLRENWEHSGYVEFNEADPQSVAQREHSKAHFMTLWDRESFELNSLEKGRILCSRHRDEKDYEEQADEARWGIVRDIIHGIEGAEKGIGHFVTTQVAADPALQAREQALEGQGMDDGSARLQALEEKMGEDGFYGAVGQVPERQALEALKPHRRG
jgi:phosphatidylserine/phosphatidylglycerophosphate/cardiolipin synthase-like enzyme